MLSIYTMLLPWSSRRTIVENVIILASCTLLTDTSTSETLNVTDTNAIGLQVASTPDVWCAANGTRQQTSVVGRIIPSHLQHGKHFVTIHGSQPAPSLFNLKIYLSRIAHSCNAHVEHSKPPGAEEPYSSTRRLPRSASHATTRNPTQPQPWQSNDNAPHRHQQHHRHKQSLRKAAPEQKAQGYSVYEGVIMPLAGLFSGQRTS